MRDLLHGQLMFMNDPCRGRGRPRDFGAERLRLSVSALQREMGALARLRAFAQELFRSKNPLVPMFPRAPLKMLSEFGAKSLR